MNILLISDQLSGNDKNIKLISWSEGRIEPSLNEFHIIVIDLSFPQTRTNLNAIKDTYLDLESKLTKSLIESDGIVLFIICGYEDKEIFNYKENIIIPEEGKYPGSLSGDQPDERTENVEKNKKTYEFLTKIDLQASDRIEFVPKGTRFIPPTNPTFKDYFKNVEQFFLTLTMDDTFEDMSPISKTAGVGNAYISFERRLDKGFIIFLPGYNPDKREAAFNSLLNICEVYFEKQQTVKNENEKAKFRGFIPEWVHKYRVDRHKHIPDEIERLKNEEECFDRICYLLYGKDYRLEEEVKLVFEEIGMDVKKSHRGESIDLICSLEDLSLEFFIEVTGTNHSINIESKKVGQVVDFKTKYPNKKVILLANTFCNLDLLERIKRDSFAEKVRNALTRLDILMLTTVDLYFLWKYVYEKKFTNVEALRLIQEQQGIFKVPEVLLPEILKKEEVN